MNWNDVQHFLAVASGGGLPAAARNLGVSQVTAWRHVRRLEETLNVRLFEERKTGYVVSPEGQRLLESAQRMEAELARVREGLAGGPGEVAGEVRLTAPEVIASALLAERLTELHGEWPQLRIELVTGSPASGLIKRETDIALRYEDISHGDFVVEGSFSVGFGVYASAEYLERHGRPVAMDRFEGHTLIAFDDSPGHVAPARWDLRGGKGAAIVFRSNSVHARVAAARSGLGCTLLPCILGDGTPGLVRLLAPSDVGSLELSCMVNRRVQSSPRIGRAGDFVRRVLSGAAQRLAGTGTE
ncbi:LysR family transcriptional regulator [Ramlibacter sp. AN1015]|uniref:LysR family transcriptional regulator n=1 Tax=Ramlibacter sp. AN1015 TaxID=3133428 RepID=UPI0030C3B108